MKSPYFLSAIFIIVGGLPMFAATKFALAQPVQNPNSSTFVPAVESPAGPVKAATEVPGNHPQPVADGSAEKSLQGDMPEAVVPAEPPDSLIERGRYISVIAGCNDCHTSGFAASGGLIPEKEWLLGDSVGFRGPWGTTYPFNLRLYMKGLTEERWLAVARNLKSRPPMPSYALNQMDENDLKALYRFIRSLGDAGMPAPKYLHPGTEPTTLYVNFEPVDPKAAASSR